MPRSPDAAARAQPVLEYPLGKQTVGRPAIRGVYERMLAQKPQFKKEEQLPTIVCGDVALTSARSADQTGVRIQVLRREADGSWVRVIDRPESK